MTFEILCPLCERFHQELDEEYRETYGREYLDDHEPRRLSFAKWQGFRQYPDRYEDLYFCEAMRHVFNVATERGERDGG